MKKLKNRAVSESERNRIFWIIILIIGVARVLMMNSVPIFGRGYNIHDDVWMAKRAYDLVQGNWMGTYDSMTLIKRPSYPIFLALCSFMEIPYLMGLGILYVGAAITFILSFKSHIKNRILLLFLYIIIIFSPAMFNGSYVQLVYRMAIIPAQVILIISCFFSMYTNRYNQLRKFLPWSLAAGFSLVFFWHTREDSIWMLPFVLGSLIITSFFVIVKYKNNMREMIKRIIYNLIPIVVLEGSIILISLINYSYYGVYATSELTDTIYPKAISTIYSIKHEDGEDDSCIQVYKSTVNKLYLVSPTFATIQDQLEDIYKGEWQTLGKYSDDGEIEYFQWALRDAVSAAGYYESAEKANNFYKQVNMEINQAFESGKLEKNEDGIILSSLSHSWNSEDMGRLLSKVIESIEWIVKYEKINAYANASEGTIENLRLMEAITSNNQIYEDGGFNVSYNGWIFSKNINNKIKLEIVNEENNMIRTVNFQNSDDVYQNYLDKGYDYEDAKHARFSDNFKLKNQGNNYFYIYVNGKLHQRISFDDSKNYYSNEYFEMYIDKKEVISEKYDSVYILSQRNLQLSTKIIKSYALSGKISILIGILSFVWIVLLMFKDIRKKKYFLLDMVLILLGILVSFIAIVGGVTYTYLDAWNSPGRNYYLAGAYPLLHMFIGISFSSLITYYLTIYGKDDEKDTY